MMIWLDRQFCSDNLFGRFWPDNSDASAAAGNGSDGIMTWHPRHAGDSDLGLTVSLWPTADLSDAVSGISSSVSPRMLFELH